MKALTCVLFEGVGAIAISLGIYRFIDLDTLDFWSILAFILGGILMLLPVLFKK